MVKSIHFSFHSEFLLGPQGYIQYNLEMFVMLTSWVKIWIWNAYKKKYDDYNVISIFIKLWNSLY